MLLIQDQHAFYYVVQLCCMAVHPFLALLFLDLLQLLAVIVIVELLLLGLGLSRSQVVVELGVSSGALDCDSWTCEVIVGSVRGGSELVADAWEVPADC